MTYFKIFLKTFLALLLLSILLVRSVVAQVVASPELVEISDWSGDAMEPFISCDGKTLYFNNRNDPGENTDLYYAERADRNRFSFKGAIPRANIEGYLDAVPSVDSDQDLFFISTRSYPSTKETLCSLRLGSSTESLKLLSIRPQKSEPGWLIMDAEISRDGQILIVADAHFVGGKLPDLSDLRMLRQSSQGFSDLPTSGDIFKEINTAALEYAPSLSHDKLKLSFTRMVGDVPIIYITQRNSIDDRFQQPKAITAIDGFAEATTISCDGHLIYFHKLVGQKFHIFQLVI
jgi:hypothetical protein